MFYELGLSGVLIFILIILWIHERRINKLKEVK